MSRRQRGSRKSSKTLTRNPPNFKTMSPKSSINPKHMQSKESYSKVHQNQDATKAVHACFNQVQLCNPMDYSPPGSSVHGILQARMLERVTVPSSRESSQPRDWTHISYIYLHWQVSSLPLALPGKWLIKMKIIKISQKQEWRTTAYQYFQSCCCSVDQPCMILCDPMDCSMPGLPVLHHLPELSQTHVHWVGDAIQPSHLPLYPQYLPSIFLNNSLF